MPQRKRSHSKAINWVGTIRGCLKSIGRIEFATTQSLVHLRGLTQNQEFLTHGGGFCLCSRDFQSPGE
ncbi:hypothetical protein [Nostoc sp. NOS(2021)]|uniref:hypothetical protein n=1 Tax=Nostoc sp. NOS(2021) TaxID=2815407 RepID=UPI0025D89A24|nr:hypothetical protein [Nostoc sp. NOS(2021)]